MSSLTLATNSTTLSETATVTVSTSFAWSGIGSTISGTGETVISSGATGTITANVDLINELDIAGGITLGNVNAGNATIQMGSASVPGFVKVESTGTLTLIGALNGFGGDGIFVAGGGFPVADPGTVENAGTIIQEEASSTSTIAVGLTNDSSGTVNVESGTLDLTGGATNNGKFETTGGTLDVTTAVSGAGTVSISGGGVAEFGSTFNQNVSFSGPGRNWRKLIPARSVVSTQAAPTTRSILRFRRPARRRFYGHAELQRYDDNADDYGYDPYRFDDRHVRGNYSNAALAAQNLLWSASSSATGAVTVSEAAPTADTWNNSTASWTTTGD